MALKILMATMSLGIGGAETHIVELAGELKKRGMDVVVVSNGGVYVPDIEAEGIRHYTAPLARRKVRDMLRSLFLLRRIIKKEKPDIVHAHARIPAFLCGLLQKTMRFPFVTTAHGVFQLGIGLNQLTNWGQKTIAVSEDIREYLKSNYGISDRDIVVTVNGIDTDKFSPDVSSSRVREEFGLDNAGPVLVHVCRLDESASLVARQLIALAPELEEELPGMTLLIVGGGDDYENLYQAAQRNNYETGRRTVIMTGARTDIAELVALGDLFIGVSRAALEAMAASKPVILAGAEGFLGLFTPYNLDAAQESNFCARGHVMPSGQRLKEEIVQVFDDMTQSERETLGRFGRELITRDYSVSRMTDDCMMVYSAVRRRRYNVVMSGYYGFGNAGDEAILQAVHQNIDRTNGDIAITVLSSNPEDTKERYGYKAVNRFKFIEVLRALKNCDALVSGGGSLLQDHTSTRSLIYYLTIIRAAKFFNRKVMIYANGIGPVRKPSNRRRVKRIVARADVITLRDDMSAQELYDMGVHRNDIRVTADPVFTLSSAPKEQAIRILEEAGVPTEQPFVCVSVRNWDSMSTFMSQLSSLLDNLHNRHGRNIVFLPMQLPVDVAVSRSVMARMKSTSYVLDKYLTAEEIMGVIAQSDFVIGMRLHALIFSARVCVPFIGIVYDPKVEAYVRALDMLSAGNVYDFDSNAAMAAIDTLLSGREQYADILKRLSTQFETLAHKDAGRLLELLES